MKVYPLIAASLLLAQGLFAEELVLVDAGSGIDPAPIILFKDAPPFTVAAAEELADYMEKISGSKPVLMMGAPAELPKRAIWLGVHPELKTLFPKLDFDFQHPEEILISANGSHIVVAGRDRWDPDQLNVQGIDEKIEGKQQEYGTVNAVYTFLQDYLNVRWLWPGELGEDVPKQKRIAFEAFEFRYHPQIRARAGAFNYSVLSNKGYGRAHLWTRRQRLQLGSMTNEGGHGFGDWWDRYHKTHPDIFALQPDGSRSGHPKPHNAKLCQSNPKILELWLEGVGEQLKKDPNKMVFNGSPNDGWSSGHCVCEKCRAWDHPDGEPRLMHWLHYREERPALSDRHVTFANELGKALKKRYPDKDYKVMMLSYGHSRPAPISARPADNVIMISVANFYGRTELVDRGSTWGTTHREQFKAWGKLAKYVMWRPNTGSPAGWQQGLPDVSINQTIEDIKFVAANNCIGIYIDAVWEHWATQGPQLYSMAQLVWDPSKEGEAVVDDYYQRAFGPAELEVRAYFEGIEKDRMAYVSEDVARSGPYHLPNLFTDELLNRSAGHLQKAELAAANGPAIYKDRVQFIRAGFDFTNLVIENIKLMSSYWQKKDQAIGSKVRENWKVMEKICTDNPYAINWGPVRPIAPRMVGLHPDHPNPKWKPGEVKDLDKN